MVDLVSWSRINTKQGKIYEFTNLKITRGHIYDPNKTAILLKIVTENQIKACLVVHCESSFYVLGS